MFSCSPTQVRSDSQRTVLRFLENCALVLGEPCSGSQRTVLWFSENRDLVLRDRALVLGEPCSGSRRTVLWFSENRDLVLRDRALVLSYPILPILPVLSYPCSGFRDSETVLWFSSTSILLIMHQMLYKHLVNCRYPGSNCRQMAQSLNRSPKTNCAQENHRQNQQHVKPG